MRPCRSSQAGRTADGRNQAIELLRVVAAFAIVWYHSDAPGDIFSHAGLSVFLILSFQFETGKNYPRKQPSAHLATRLLVPWAFWVCVYSGIFLAAGKPLLTGYSNWLSWLLGGGPTGHLWYLPYVFSLLLLAGWLKQRISPKHLQLVALVLLLLLIATAPLWREWSLSQGTPLAQYAQALPAVLLGVIIGNNELTKRHPILLVALGVVAVAALFPLTHRMATPHLIAAFAVLVAMRLIEVPANPVSRRFAPYMLGVYLAHPLFLLAIPRFPLPYLLAEPVAAFLASVAFVAGVRSILNRFAPKLAVVV